MRLYGGIAGFVVHRKKTEKRDKEDMDEDTVYEGFPDSSDYSIFWIIIDFELLRFSQQKIH